MIRRVFCLTVLSLLALAGLGLAAAPAPFSLYYNVEGIAQPAELVQADPLPVGIMAMDLTRGPGIKKATLTNGFSADGWDSAQSREACFNSGAYFQFGFTVQSGAAVSLSTLDMSLRRSAKNGPMNLELQVSFDGFKTPGVIISEFNYYGRTSGTRPYPDPHLEDPFYHMHSDLPGHANSVTSPGDPIPTIDLTKSGMLQDIPEGTEVTFRLYAWGNESTTGTNTVALGRMVGPRLGGVVTSK